METKNVQGSTAVNKQEELIPQLGDYTKGILYEGEDYRIIIISNSADKNIDLLKNGAGELAGKNNLIVFGK